MYVSLFFVEISVGELVFRRKELPEEFISKNFFIQIY